jgi:hypothetical protein
MDEPKYLLDIGSTQGQPVSQSHKTNAAQCLSYTRRSSLLYLSNRIGRRSSGINDAHNARQVFIHHQDIGITTDLTICGTNWPPSTSMLVL